MVTKQFSHSSKLRAHGTSKPVSDSVQYASQLGPPTEVKVYFDRGLIALGAHDYDK